jgi:membrane protein implicated in regulation of membrane protease activity
MTDLLGWVALAATCVAAIVTAANLGARITGYGFAVFFVGAVAWSAVGAATGQHQLLWSNVFLAVVDLIGVWRWLYRRARAEDAVERAKDEEKEAPEELFALDSLVGKSVVDQSGRTVAAVEGALSGCDSGALRFLVVRLAGTAGNDRSFKRLPWERCRRVSSGTVSTNLTTTELQGLPDT